jgi:hypothetical protein
MLLCSLPGARAVLLILAIVAVPACGSDNSTNLGDEGTPSDALPAELVGTWHLEQAGDPICDPDTGECTQSFARSETLELRNTGTFEHALFFESNLPPCNLTVHHESSGTTEASGTTLQLRISEGLTHVEDNCGDRGGDTNEAGNTETFTYQVSQGSGGGPELKLTDDQGTEIGPYEQE